MGARNNNLYLTFYNESEAVPYVHLPEYHGYPVVWTVSAGISGHAQDAPSADTGLYHTGKRFSKSKGFRA